MGLIVLFSQVAKDPRWMIVVSVIALLDECTEELCHLTGKGLPQQEQLQQQGTAVHLN